MFSRLRHAWAQRQQAAALKRRAIPDALWRRTLKRFPFLQRRHAADEARLRTLTSLFLDSKEFSGAGGFRVTDDVAVAIAAQACLPVLRLGLSAYDGFVGIVVHGGPVLAARQTLDEHGVMHDWDETLSGEAMEGGPVTLSWRDVRAAGATAARGYNVVIHEFAHVLDMAAGGANGLPFLADSQLARQWPRVMQTEFTRFSAKLEAGEDTVLDPYAAEAPEEFFAVASEAFFVAPQALWQEQPELYTLLKTYYGQDPKEEMRLSVVLEP